MMMENGGVDIDFTSGFPSMSVHYLSANSGSYGVDEASQNFWGPEKLAAINRICYTPSRFSYMLRFIALIPHVHYKIRRPFRTGVSPESIPISLGGGSVAPISTRRIAAFVSPSRSLPHPLKQYPDPFHPNLSQSVPITRTG